MELLKVDLSTENLARIIAEEVAKIIKPLLLKDPDEDQIFDVKGLCVYTGLSDSWVYANVTQGKLPYFNAGRFIKFRKKEIDKWIESQSRRPINPLDKFRKKQTY